MAQDSTPSMVIFQGDGSNRLYSIPFDKGYYGEVRVAFVRRGPTDYEYNPDTYTLGGHLYAWGSVAGVVYTDSPFPVVGSHVYNNEGVVTESIVTAVDGTHITVGNKTVNGIRKSYASTMKLYAWKDEHTQTVIYTDTPTPTVFSLVYDASGHKIPSGSSYAVLQNGSAEWVMYNSEAYYRYADGDTTVTVNDNEPSQPGSGNNNEPSQPGSGSGGTVNTGDYERRSSEDIERNNLLHWTGEVLGVNDYICIVRDTLLTQPFVYPNNQKHIEDALDNLERQIQEVKSADSFALHVDPSYDNDPQKMDPIAWLETIVRSKDLSAREVRVGDGWLMYSSSNPEVPEEEKEWTRVLNTQNVRDVKIQEGTFMYQDKEGNWHSLAAEGSTKVDDVQLNGVSVVVDKIANIEPVAGDIAYTNPRFPSMATLQDAMDELLYVNPAVSVSGGGDYEIGSTRAKTKITWSWNKTIQSQSLNQGIGDLDPTVREYTYETEISSDTTFTVTGSDGKKTVSGSTKVAFLPKRYWGVSASPTLTDSGIIGLNSELSTSRTQTRTFDCSGGKYFYFAIKTSYCTNIKFKVGGLSFSDMDVETRQFTNASGHTDSYNIYRVHNLQTGAAILVEVL